MSYEVKIWPFGLGEAEGAYAEDAPDYATAVLRAIEEVADWHLATIDPDNGDTPEYTLREMGMDVAKTIYNAAFSVRDTEDQEAPSYMMVPGPMNEMVEIVALTTQEAA